MMKRKILIPVLALMLCVGMIGVGFAAWVIATTTTADVNEGTQFTVYDVANKSVQFESEFEDGSVTFGTTSTTYEHPWLTLEEGTAEDLSATLEISITNWSDVSASDKVVTIQISAMSIMSGSSNVTETYEDKYVVLPAARTITITAGALDQTSIDAGITLENGVLTIPMTFDWGSYFGGENPHDFYNSHASGATMEVGDPGYDSAYPKYVDHANYHLKAFYAMNNLSFQVTVTADLTVN